MFKCVSFIEFFYFKLNLVPVQASSVRYVIFAAFKFRAFREKMFLCDSDLSERVGLYGSNMLFRLVGPWL